jgi:hypothetical protein
MNAEKPDPTPSGPAAPLMSTALGVGLMTPPQTTAAAQALGVGLMTYPFQGGSNLI